MIRVHCAACGATFGARDEHAGRRGKCSRCGAPVTVPSAAAAQPPAPSATPAPAVSPAPAAPRAPAAPSAPVPAAVVRGAARAPSGGRREPRGRTRHGGESAEGPPKWLLPALVVMVVGGVAGFFALRGGGPDAVKLVQAGREALQAGDYDAAIASLAQVPADSRLYGQAQEVLKEAQEQRAAILSAEARGDADRLAATLQSIRRDWIEKYGPSGKQYAEQTRYLLERAAEFVQRFPDDPRAVEYRGYPAYYARVASLDRPPTVRDVSVEIEWRAQAGEWREALAEVQAFAGRPDVAAEDVERLRREMREMADGEWQVVKGRLERREAFRPGDENWKQILSQTGTYLQSVAGIEGAGAEAREWHARAEAALAGAGG